MDNTKMQLRAANLLLITGLLIPILLWGAILVSTFLPLRGESGYGFFMLSLIVTPYELYLSVPLVFLGTALAIGPLARDAAARTVKNVLLLGLALVTAALCIFLRL